MPSADTTTASRRRSAFNERSRRRKIVLLLLLLLLLAAIGYTANYFLNNKRLPLPGAAAAGTIDPPQYLFSITGGAGKDALEKPTGVAVSRSGRVYVTDVTMRRMRIFTLDGKPLGTFSDISDGKNTTLVTPVHIAISPDDEVYVSDRRLRGIYVFDANGKYLRKFEPADPKVIEGWTPLALAFDSKGRLFVSDVGRTDRHRILAFEPDGSLLAVWGSTAQVTHPDENTGKFFFPNGLIVIKDKLFVADGDNRRLQVFDPKGTFAYIVGTSGVPRGLSTDAQGRLYVVDALAHQIDIYTPEGKVLTTFGGNGVGPGQFNFPNDVSVAPNGRIYIADRENKQVQVWGFPTSAVPIPTLPQTPLQWLWCLPPLLLLLIPFLRRRRTFVVTPDFIEAAIAAGAVDALDNRRLNWVIRESDHPPFVGRVEEGVDLGDLLSPETFSESDAIDLEQRLEVPHDIATVLAMARREKRLATEDANLRQLALLVDVDVYGLGEFLAQYGPKERSE